MATLLDLGFGSGCSETDAWYAGRPEDELAPPLGATAGGVVGLALAFAFALPTATEQPIKAVGVSPRPGVRTVQAPSSALSEDSGMYATTAVFDWLAGVAAIWESTNGITGPMSSAAAA